MTLKEAIQKDCRRHLYVKSAITFGTFFGISNKVVKFGNFEGSIIYWQ